GRDARAMTDAQLKAQILSYSRSQGLFAGLDLTGGVLKPDRDANRTLYRRDVAARDILFGNGAKLAAASEFTKALADSDRAARATSQASGPRATATGGGDRDVDRDRSRAPARRFEDAGAVLRDLRALADRGIPENLLDRAHCIAVFPGVKKAAFIVGGE